MSVRRILGLLSVVLGLLVGLFGAMMLVSAERFMLAQPLVLVAGCVLVLIGALVLKSTGSGPTPADGESAKTEQSVGISPAGATLAVLMMILFGWFYFGGGIEWQANRSMQDIKNKVATDAVAQYGIAKRNGTPIDVCVQAGFVAAAYLQAQDEANYQRWKQTEKADCADAGIEK